MVDRRSVVVRRGMKLMSSWNVRCGSVRCFGPIDTSSTTDCQPVRTMDHPDPVAFVFCAHHARVLASRLSPRASRDRCRLRVWCQQKSCFTVPVALTRASFTATRAPCALQTRGPRSRKVTLLSWPALWKPSGCSCHPFNIPR